jgi:hypothetical protein
VDLSYFIILAIMGIALALLSPKRTRLAKRNGHHLGKTDDRAIMEKKDA